MKILNIHRLVQQENHAHKLTTSMLTIHSNKLMFYSKLNKTKFALTISTIMIFLPIHNICK